MNEHEIPVSLIVAVAENGVIGRKNSIPWACSSDMKHFRSTTMGKPVIMGRKTFESLGRPLKGRENIVLTRNAGFKAPGAYVVTRVTDALQLAGSFVSKGEGTEIMVIGGKAVYDAFFERAGRIYYTLIHLQPAGDTCFDTLADLAQRGWRQISRIEQAAGGKDEADMSFIVLEKIKKP